MKCKVLVGGALQKVSLEDQINEFLSDNSVKIEDIKLVPFQPSIYVFIFYTENKYLKPSEPLMKLKTRN